MANERKKIKDLTIEELAVYYDLAQKRYDQEVRMCQINRTDPTLRRNNEEQRKFTALQMLVKALTSEIEHRLIDNIDLS